MWGYRWTVLGWWEFVDWKEEPRCAEMHMGRFHSFFLSLRGAASPVLSLGSGELSRRMLCLRIYFPCIQFISHLGNISHWHRWVSLRRQDTLKFLTSPVGNILQPVINFFLQGWKSLAVYEALASPIVSEKSLPKYSTVPAGLPHLTKDEEQVQEH